MFEPTSNQSQAIDSCHNFVRQPELLKCLQNQTLLFLGDSTIRQWYEYLVRFILKDTAVEKLATFEHTGPHNAIDEAHNIRVLYRFHGFPMRNMVLDKDMEYIPNIIDDINDENEVVIILTICAHFTATNITFYQNRLYKIRDAEYKDYN